MTYVQTNNKTYTCISTNQHKLQNITRIFEAPHVLFPNHNPFHSPISYHYLGFSYRFLLLVPYVPKQHTIQFFRALNFICMESNCLYASVICMFFSALSLVDACTCDRSIYYCGVLTRLVFFLFYTTIYDISLKKREVLFILSCGKMKTQAFALTAYYSKCFLVRGMFLRVCVQR